MLPGGSKHQSIGQIFCAQCFYIQWHAKTCGEIEISEKSFFRPTLMHIFYLLPFLSPAKLKINHFRRERKLLNEIEWKTISCVILNAFDAVISTVVLGIPRRVNFYHNLLDNYAHFVARSRRIYRNVSRFFNDEIEAFRSSTQIPSHYHKFLSF